MLSSRRLDEPGLVHHEDAAGDERVAGSPQHRGRVGLVVDGVEHEHHVEGPSTAKLGRVAPLERDVGQTPTRAALGPPLERGAVEVEAEERRRRGRPPRARAAVAGSARDVAAACAPAAAARASPGPSGRISGTSSSSVQRAPERVHHVVQLREVGVRRAPRHRAGTPRPLRGRAGPAVVKSRPTGARFATPAPVRQAACSPAAASRSPSPGRTRRCRAVTIAPSHSRT